MSDTKKSKRIYWLISLVSIVLTIFLIAVKPAWFWVGLPFFLTSTVLAMDIV
jgi:hypothetical protein